MKKNYIFINLVKDFILKNIDQENLTIDEVASELCMSRTTFFNKWKSLTGEAPKYFIYRIRMEKARELLESGRYSVNVVPEMIGLRNLKNFRHKYKRIFWNNAKRIYNEKTIIYKICYLLKGPIHRDLCTAFLQKNILFFISLCSILQLPAFTLCTYTLILKINNLILNSMKTLTEIKKFVVLIA